MTDRRAKAFATATVLGLGALGGIALGSNPGAPSPTQPTAGATAAAVVTSASGNASVPATQTAIVNHGAAQRAPIVTRASGGGPAFAPRED